MRDNTKIAYDVEAKDARNFKNRMASYKKEINAQKLKKEERQGKKK